MNIFEFRSYYMYRIAILYRMARAADDLPIIVMKPADSIYLNGTKYRKRMGMAYPVDFINHVTLRRRLSFSYYTF